MASPKLPSIKYQIPIKILFVCDGEWTSVKTMLKLYSYFLPSAVLALELFFIKFARIVLI